jgi:release factor glutamine methyltransferase
MSATLLPGPPSRSTRLAVKLLFRGQKLLGRHHYDDFILERVAGVPILVTPSVFNPKRLRTGAFFASVLAPPLIDLDTTVLDMGTGSGVCAVFAAKSGARVVAVDINRAATHCARVNALLNRVEQRIDVREGDLFTAVPGRRFDLVLFNPPFLRGTPRDDRDRAWRSEDVPERFAAELRDHLNPRGCALLLLSTFGDSGRFLDELRHRGHALSLVAQRDCFGERLGVFRVVPP